MLARKEIRSCCLLMAFLLLGSGLLRAQDLGLADRGSATASPPDASDERFAWKSALVDTSIFMGIEQGFRIVEDPKIRRGLRGPFFRGYFDSVANISGWSDGDRPLTNYVGHPMAGSIAGYIEVRHDPRYRQAEFGWTSRYWKSRMRAMGFAAVYSLEFEIGPISEASIGNIQLDPRKRGVVDWVVTPTVGTAWMVSEDIADRYVIQSIERHTRNRAVIAFSRSLLNPTRSLSNLIGRRRPWQRDDRQGVNFLAGRAP